MDYTKTAAESQVQDIRKLNEEMKRRIQPIESLMDRAKREKFKKLQESQAADIERLNKEKQTKEEKKAKTNQGNTSPGLRPINYNQPK